jgi:predicted ribosome quality control (RQC) complex YloA/Tae2 family protein
MHQEDSKKLYDRKKKLERDLQEIRSTKYALQKEENLKQQELTKINDNLNKLKRGELVITDHAIVRYMERVKNLPLEEVKKLLLPDSTRALIGELGNGKFPAGGTHSVVVKDNIVLTVIANNQIY